MVSLNNIMKLKQANIETDLAKVLDFEKVLNETKKNRPWHEHGLFGMIPGLRNVEEGIKDLASTGLGYLGEPLEKRELSLKEHASKYGDLVNSINENKQKETWHKNFGENFHLGTEYKRLNNDLSSTSDKIHKEMEYNKGLTGTDKTIHRVNEIEPLKEKYEKVREALYDSRFDNLTEPEDFDGIDIYHPEWQKNPYLINNSAVRNHQYEAQNNVRNLVEQSGIKTMDRKNVVPTGIIPDYQNAYNSLIQHDNFSSDVGTLGTMGLLGGAGYAAYKGAGAIKNVLAKKSLGLAKELAETNMIPEHQIEEVAGSMFDKLHQHVMEHKLSYAGGIGAGVAGIGLTANHLINNPRTNDGFHKTLKEQLGQGDYNHEKTAGFSHKSKLKDLNKQIELESLKQRLNEIHQNPLTNKDIADKIEGAVNNLGDRISGELSGNRKVKIDAINAVGDGIHKNINAIGEHAGKSLAEVAKTLAPYSPHIALGMGALGVGYAANSLFGNNK